MAKIGRPIKENADFFSHDSNASEDIKLMALESRMGLEGYAIYFKVLELLTKSNKFQLDMSKKYISDGIPQLIKINPELFEKFLKNAVELELLIFDENKILFSRGLRKRLQVPVKYRRYDRNRKKTFPDGKVPENSGKSSSKVKESKVKESKVKECEEEPHTPEPKKKDEVLNIWQRSFGRNPKIPEREKTEDLISQHGFDNVLNFYKDAVNKGFRNLQTLLDAKGVNADGALFIKPREVKNVSSEYNNQTRFSGTSRGKGAIDYDVFAKELETCTEK